MKLYVCNYDTIYIKSSYRLPFIHSAGKGGAASR